jgi:DNA-directed RNA polymerase subunit N (RpoN/RPB10)
MKKIRCFVCWPFVGTQDEEYIIEVDDDATQAEIDEIAAEVCNDLIYNRVDCGWEEV